MEMYLSELIDQANECLKNLGLLSGTIDDYQSSAFRPIERRLGNPLITSTDILINQEDFFNGLYNSGDISRQTLNWRIRGIRVLSEVYDTGEFKWKVFSRKEQPCLHKAYETILDQFIESQECCDILTFSSDTWVVEGSFLTLGIISYRISWQIITVPAYFISVNSD